MAIQASANPANQKGNLMRTKLIVGLTAGMAAVLQTQTGVAQSVSSNFADTAGIQIPYSYQEVSQDSTTANDSAMTFTTDSFDANDSAVLVDFSGDQGSFVAWAGASSAPAASVPDSVSAYLGDTAYAKYRSQQDDNSSMNMSFASYDLTANSMPMWTVSSDSSPMTTTAGDQQYSAPSLSQSASASSSETDPAGPAKSRAVYGPEIVPEPGVVGMMMLGGGALISGIISRKKKAA